MNYDANIGCKALSSRRRRRAIRVYGDTLLKCHAETHLRLRPSILDRPAPPRYVWYLALGSVEIISGDLWRRCLSDAVIRSIASLRYACMQSAHAQLQFPVPRSLSSPATTRRSLSHSIKTTHRCDPNHRLTGCADAAKRAALISTCVSTRIGLGL